MMMPLVSSFGDLALSFSSVFTSPSFANFLTILNGWVFCLGRRTVTGLIVAAGAIEEKHFSCFHRFFSRAVWNLDPLGRIILELTLRFVPKAEVALFVVDDTLGRKTGRHIWGAGMPDSPNVRGSDPSGITIRCARRRLAPSSPSATAGWCSR